MGAVFRTTGPLTEAEAHLYVERAEDREVAAHVRRGIYVTLMGGRQTGKTSLLLRLRRQLRDEGHIALYLDLSPAQDQDQERWYDHLRTVMQEQLDLTLPGLLVPPMQDQLAFRAALGQISRLSPRSSNQIVVLMDEISAVPEPVAEPFFSVIRTIFNEREPNPDFRRYAFVMAGAFNPNELIKNPSISPFNVAAHVYMSDADCDGLAPLARNLEQLGFTVPDDVVERIYEWTGGHLYLTQRLCSFLESSEPRELTVQQIDAVIDELLNDRHIIHLCRELEENPDARHVLQIILSGHRPVRFDRNNSLVVRLELIGIIKPDAANRCVVRNRIYERVLRNHPRLISGEALELTPKEHDLFMYFSRNINRTCSIHEIATAIWGEGSFGERKIENRVHSLVRRLRRKVDAHPGSRLRIVTVHGRGYKPQREPS